MLQVFSGSCGSLVSLGCDDDGCGSASTVTVPVVAGQYRVRVAVHADLGQGARFEGTLLLGVHDAQWKLLGMGQ